MRCLPALIALTLIFAFEPILAQPAAQDIPAKTQDSPGEKDTPADPHHALPLQPGDAFGEEVMLPERTIIYVKGTTKWEVAFETLVKSFKTLRDTVDKQGIMVNGPAMAIYTKTDENGFEFEAALPISAAPANLPGGEIAIGQAPSGKALKFVHRGSYRATETTYEAISDYFDDKDLEAKEILIEEYTTDPITANADDLVINVFVPLK